MKHLHYVSTVFSTLHVNQLIWRNYSKWLSHFTDDKTESYRGQVAEGLPTNEWGCLSVGCAPPELPSVASSHRLPDLSPFLDLLIFFLKVIAPNAW